MELISTKRFIHKVMFVVGLGSLLATMIFAVPRAHATCDTDSTAIIYCGLNTSSVQASIDSLRSIYNNNTDGYGHGNIQTALNWVGFSSSLIGNMNTNNTLKGEFYRDGRVVVEGRVVNDVSQKAWVTTRYAGSGYQNVGNGIYARLSTTNSHEPEAVLVTFDSTGRAVAVVMTRCGNGVKIVPLPAPSASCTNLNAVLIDFNKRYYDFTANTSVDNAKLVSGSFSFGDGSSGSASISGNTAKASHSYTKGGTYTITATLKFSVSGATLTKTCSTKVTVADPVFECTGLTYAILNKEAGKYSFTAKAKTENVTLTGGSFNFGDGTTSSGNVSGSSVITEHTFSKSGTYTVTATIKANGFNTTYSKTCKTTLTVGLPYYECVALKAVPFSDMKYTFTASSRFGNGAVLTGADFNFGDGTSASVSKSSSSNSITVDHTYKLPGEYSVNATLRFTVGGKAVTAKTCSTKVKPTLTPFYSCVDLKADGPYELKYKFTASSKYGNGAVFTGADFNFGDGTVMNNVKPTSSDNVSVEHNYKKPGEYKVTAVLIFIVNGKTVKAPGCSVIAKPSVTPFYECVELRGPEPNEMKYSFVATARSGNGAVLTGADFNFGDGTSVTGVKPSSATTVKVDHTYSKAGQYSVSAILKFSLDGKTVTAPACNALVKPAEPPVPECKPGIPVGDVRCNPCPYDASLAADDPRCKEPEVMPNTGAGNVIALTATALVGGFLFYRRRVFEMNKAAFAAAEVGGSPLPLADPLTPENPLINTPLESQVSRGHSSTFRRRRRQF